MALCGMETTHLIYAIINILGIYFSGNGKLTQEKNFLNNIVKIQNILKSWKLIYEGRFAVFNLLTFPKLIHLA